MSSDTREATAAKIRRLIATEGDAVKENTRVFNQGRREATASLDDYEALREEARAIKEDAIDRLPDLLDRLEAEVEANGGTVYLAEDAADARAYVRDVCGDQDAESVVKSKSMTTEEIELNAALQDAGMTVTETDLGEWVIQLADETPSHIVGPAIHKSRESIAELFAERFDPADPPQTAEELTRFARAKLLERVKQADVGITGANFVTADSGTIALVTSEGNARKTAVTPDTHVAVTGVEKIIPTVEDLYPFIELIGRSGTGQELTSYLSLFTPPVSSPSLDFDHPDRPLSDPGGQADTTGGSATGQGQSDREFHLVLIDNGRFEMREDEDLRETLYCIRCGACSNSCGNFQSVGGHAFGGETYSGGIATGWEAGIEGEDVAAGFNDLCTGCSRCVPACPVKIDIPWINTAVRDRINRGTDPGAFDHLVDGLVPDEEQPGMSPSKRVFGNFESLARLGSRTAPLTNRVLSLGPLRNLLDRALGVSDQRELPQFAREPLVEWFERRGGPTVSSATAEREAVLYPDVYTNYVDTDRGKAAIRTLESLGVRVRVPPTAGSGRAPISQGMVRTARTKAARVQETLQEELRAGRDIVVVEPSALAMFRREYERLLPEEDTDRLADNSFGVMEYLFGLLENGADLTALRTPADADRSGRDAHEPAGLAYHPHCQGRTIGTDEYAVAVLERLGYDVLVSETECCGMAGSFGYKSDYYELSMDVGEPLVAQFGDTDRRVVASGTSCEEQLGDLLGRDVSHPVEVIAPAAGADV